METIEITRTEKGEPALWEYAVSRGDYCEYTLIAGPDGKIPKPVVVEKGMFDESMIYKLYKVETGMYVVKVLFGDRKYEIYVWRITRITDDKVWLEKVGDYHAGYWYMDAPRYLKRAIDKAVDMACECYKLSQYDIFEEKEERDMVDRSKGRRYYMTRREPYCPMCFSSAVTTDENKWYYCPECGWRSRTGRAPWRDVELDEPGPIITRENTPIIYKAIETGYRIESKIAPRAKRALRKVAPGLWNFAEHVPLTTPWIIKKHKEIVERNT